MATHVDIAFDPRGKSYDYTVALVESIISDFGGIPGGVMSECSGRGKHIDTCQCIVSGSFSDFSEDVMAQLREQVRTTRGIWIDAIVAQDKLNWGSKLYRRSALKLR